MIIPFATFMGIFAILGYLLAGSAGLAIALVFSLLLAVIVFASSTKIILHVIRAVPFENEEVQKILKHLCHEAEIHPPHLYHLPSLAINTCAIGSPSHSLLIITDGILSLSEKEKEAVLAHEVAHIRNKDIRLATFVAALAVMVSLPAQKGYEKFQKAKNSEEKILPVVAMVLFGLPASLIVKISLPRFREFKADWFGSLLTKDPESLANVLRKCSAVGYEGNRAISPIWLINPFKAGEYASLFSVHPFVQRRIERLEILRPLNI